MIRCNIVKAKLVMLTFVEVLSHISCNEAENKNNGEKAENYLQKK